MASETDQPARSDRVTGRIQAGDRYGLRVNLRDLPPELKTRIDDAISDFEANHEEDVFNGQDGMVPRVRPIDYIGEAILGVILTLYLVVTFI